MPFQRFLVLSLLVCALAMFLGQQSRCGDLPPEYFSGYKIDRTKTIDERIIDLQVNIDWRRKHHRHDHASEINELNQLQKELAFYLSRLSLSELRAKVLYYNRVPDSETHEEYQLRLPHHNAMGKIFEAAIRDREIAAATLQAEKQAKKEAALSEHYRQLQRKFETWAANAPNKIAAAAFAAQAAKNEALAEQHAAQQQAHLAEVERIKGNIEAMKSHQALAAQHQAKARDAESREKTYQQKAEDLKKASTTTPGAYTPASRAAGGDEAEPKGSLPAGTGGTQGAPAPQ